MPIYSYVAKDASGRTVRSQASAVSEQDLKTRLVRRNLFIISVQEKKGLLPRIFFQRKKIKTEDLIVFCKQLATLLKGGVPIIRAIDAITSELKDSLFEEKLSEISHHIRGGESLSESLKRSPDLFSPLFIAMSEAGEKSGSLESMLERLSDYLHAQDRLHKKIVSAMVYPAFIVFFFLAAMGIFTVFLIPRFKSIYQGFGAQLPLMTRIVFGMSDAVVHNLPVIIVVTIVSAFLFNKYFFKTKAGRHWFDKMTLKLPLFGTFLKNAALSKFSRTLATLLGHGIPIAASIELVGKTSGNSIIDEASAKVKKLILDGGNIPDALKKAEIFPSLMIQMVSVGVESGNLPELLNKTADFYEERVDSFVAVLTTMMEPVMLGVLGVVVGVMIVALYLPIFKLSQAALGGAGR